MKIIENLTDLPKFDKTVVTSGTFDGVHLGHQKILERVITHSQSIRGKSVVITFWPHPRFVLNENHSNLKLLSTFDEKSLELANNGIDILLKIPFTKEFSLKSSTDFINEILLDRLNTKILVIGYDHRFGHNREGSFKYLKANESKFGFVVEEIPKQELEDVAISSTKIRNALLESDVASANQYLGRPYALTGHVTKGNKIGRTIGFPTANIVPNDDFKLIPKNGVYAVRVYTVGKRNMGMLNIGIRPTLGGTHRTMEVNIFNFTDDIYNQEIRIEFIEKIRDEIKFENLTQLMDQLNSDKFKALEIFDHIK